MRVVSAICTALLVTACSSETGDSASTSEPVIPIRGHPEGSTVPQGRYALPFVGSDQAAVEAVVDVAEGFEPYNGSFLWNGTDDASYALSFWRITGVNPEPCRADPPTYQDPGPTVSDLATALRRQPHRHGPDATPVELAGYEGLYLELTLPRGFKPDRCATGSYEAWQAVDPETYASHAGYQYGPGWVDRIWILDFEGEPLVVNAAFDPHISDSNLAALESMVDSVELRTRASK